MSNQKLHPEKLIDSEVKIALLRLFHENPNEVASIEGFSKLTGRSPKMIKGAIDDLITIGLMKKGITYSFNPRRFEQIEKTLSYQLSRQLSILKTKERRLMGIEILDRLIPEGYASPAMVLISADPGTNEAMLCTQLISERLKKGDSVVYATFDNLPNNVRNQVSKQGLSVDRIGRQGDLVFLDCYSNQLREESKEIYSADLNDISTISRTLSIILNDFPKSILILDSLTTMILKCGDRQAMEFLRVTSAKTQKSGVDCFVTFNRKAFPPTTAAIILNIVDGVIELKTEEDQNDLNCFIRILKMNGVKYTTTWTPYEVDERQVFFRESQKDV